MTAGGDSIGKSTESNSHNAILDNQENEHSKSCACVEDILNCINNVLERKYPTFAVQRGKKKNVKRINN